MVDTNSTLKPGSDLRVVLGAEPPPNLSQGITRTIVVIALLTTVTEVSVLVAEPSAHSVQVSSNCLTQSYTGLSTSPLTQ